MLHIKLLAATVLLMIVVLSQSITAQAATSVGETACSAGNCLLACNASLRICSLFPAGRVPGGYKRVKHISFGYRRVRQSVCDKLVCPDRSATCRQSTPTGASQGAHP